jgi:hypothetical protein
LTFRIINKEFNKLKSRYKIGKKQKEIMLRNHLDKNNMLTKINLVKMKMMIFI